MPEKIPRFDIFFDAHIGIGLRWRKSMFFGGYDISLALPGFCMIFSFGKNLRGAENLKNSNTPVEK